MNKILTRLLIAATLFSTALHAEETLRPATENSQRRIEFTLHGKTSCVLVDDKIFCAPGATRAPVKLVSTALN